MKHARALLMLLTPALPLGAQLSFSGPVAGYVFDGYGRSLRPVLGGLGAAYLGPESATRWVYAAVSPNGKTALGLQRGRVELIADLATPERYSPLSNAIPIPESIAWSRDSSTAVLYSATAKLLQRVTGFGGTPEVHSAVDLSQLGGNPVSSWSVSSDGHTIAVVTTGAGTASVYLLTDDTIPTAPLATLSDAGLSTFAGNGGSLFVAEPAEKKIVQLQIPSGSTEGSFDASSLPPIVDMQTSADGSLVYVLGSRTLTALDISTWQPSWTKSLDMTPTSLTEFSVAPPVFLLNYDRGDTSPVWLFNGQVAQLYFVPTANAGANASR